MVKGRQYYQVKLINKNMKNYYNKKLLHSSSALILIALLSVSPVLASAEGIRLGLGSDVRANVGVKVDLENKAEKEDYKVKFGTKASTTISSTSTINLNDNRLPPGIRKAPGIENRVEEDRSFPKGLFKFFEDGISRFLHHGDKDKKATTTDATSTPETILPKIQGLKVINGTSSVEIVWDTNEQTTGQVQYSTTSPVNASSSLKTDITLSTNHSLVLSGLNPDSKYYYVVTVKDADGNVKVSSEKSFTTKTLDVKAPSILFSVAIDVKAISAQLVWITNEKSDSRVWVSTTTPVAVSGSSTVSSTNMTYFHSLTLSNLTAGTKYYYALESADVSGNASVSSFGSFTTSSN